VLQLSGEVSLLLLSGRDLAQISPRAVDRPVCLIPPSLRRGPLVFRAPSQAQEVLSRSPRGFEINFLVSGSGGELELSVNNGIRSFPPPFFRFPLAFELDTHTHHPPPPLARCEIAFSFPSPFSPRGGF